MHPKTLDGIARSTDVFLASLTGGAPAALPLALTGPDLPVKGAETGFVAASGSPNKSYCMTELKNGGVILSSLPDIDDNFRESRRFANN